MILENIYDFKQQLNQENNIEYNNVMSKKQYISWQK